MTKDEALKLALDALKTIDEAMPFPVAKLAQAAIKEALAQPDTVQVSPLEFVARVTGKEEIIGVPAFWAQWPSKELNT